MTVPLNSTCSCMEKGRQEHHTAHGLTTYVTAVVHMNSITRLALLRYWRASEREVHTVLAAVQTLAHSPACLRRLSTSGRERAALESLLSEHQARADALPASVSASVCPPSPGLRSTTTATPLASETYSVQFTYTLYLSDLYLARPKSCLGHVAQSVQQWSPIAVKARNRAVFYP